MRKLRGLLVLALIVVASVAVVSAATEKCVVTGRECDGSISANVEGETFFFSSRGAKRLFELRPEKYVNKAKGIKTCPVTGAKAYGYSATKATCPKGCNCTVTSKANCPKGCNCTEVKKASCPKGCNCTEVKKASCPKGCNCTEVKKPSSSCATCPSKKSCSTVKKTVCENGCNCSSVGAVKSQGKRSVKKYSFKEEGLGSMPSGCPTDKSQCGDCTGCDK